MTQPISSLTKSFEQLCSAPISNPHVVQRIILSNEEKFLNPFPAEIIRKIFSYLNSATDAQNARLLCRDWGFDGLDRMKYLTALGAEGIDLDDAQFLNPETGVPFAFPRPNNHPYPTKEMLAAMKNAARHAGGAIIITFPEDISWDTVKSLSQQVAAATFDGLIGRIGHLNSIGIENEQALQKNPIKAGTYIYTKDALQKTSMSPVSQQLGYLQAQGFDEEFLHPGVWIVMQIFMSVLGKRQRVEVTPSNVLDASGNRFVVSCSMHSFLPGRFCLNVYPGHVSPFRGFRSDSDGASAVGVRKFLQAIEP